MTMLTNSVKNILEKLLKGEDDFKCTWNGEQIGVKILQIDFSTNSVYVRFEKEVTKTINEFIDQPFSYETDPPQIMVEKLVKTQYEWLSIG